MSKDKKIDRTQEELLSEGEKREAKRKLAAKGIAAGSSAAALGGLIAGMGRNFEKKLEKGGEIWLPGDSSGRVDPEKLRKLGPKGKAYGYGLLAAGIPTLGVSAYVHYKNRKKKDDNKA